MKMACLPTRAGARREGLDSSRANVTVRLRVVLRGFNEQRCISTLCDRCDGVDRLYSTVMQTLIRKKKQ